jgi:hypothetical protein
VYFEKIVRATVLVGLLLVGSPAIALNLCGQKDSQTIDGFNVYRDEESGRVLVATVPFSMMDKKTTSLLDRKSISLGARAAIARYLIPDSQTVEVVFRGLQTVKLRCRDKVFVAFVVKEDDIKLSGQSNRPKTRVVGRPSLPFIENSKSFVFLPF